MIVSGTLDYRVCSFLWGVSINWISQICSEKLYNECSRNNCCSPPSQKIKVTRNHKYFALVRDVPASCCHIGQTLYWYWPRGCTCAPSEKLISVDNKVRSFDWWVSWSGLSAHQETSKPNMRNQNFLLAVFETSCCINLIRLTNRQSPYVCSTGEEQIAKPPTHPLQWV